MGMKGKTFKTVFSACTSIVALSICLTAGAVQGTGTVDAVGGLNLRSGQTTTSGKITVLPDQAKVQINYENNGWYNVTYAGLTGFVKQEYVKVDETSQQEVQSATDTTQQNGEVQYRVVNAEGGLRLRGTPDANGQVLDIMPYNSRIQFIVRDGEWAQVVYNGTQGYCSAMYLRMDDASENQIVETPISDPIEGEIESTQTGVEGYISISGGLRLRSSGSTDAEILATMPQYATVTILDDSTGWAKVSYQGKVGYCSRQYIAYGAPENAAPIQTDKQENATPSTEQATVNADGGLSLRSEASTDGERLTVIPNGSSVVITSTRDDGWSEVVYGNLTGYVSNDYLINYQSGTNNEGNEGNTNHPKTKGEEVVECAKQFLGVPYVYGGTSPEGFDCSGLTYYVYKQFDVTLNRTSSAQFLNGTSVNKSDLQPGDLVFFSQNGSSSIGHVGIYVGNDQFIHSPQTGDVVKISSMTSASYSLRYVGARRIFND